MLLKTLFKKDLSVTLSCRQSILVLLSDNKNYHVNMLQTISKIEQLKRTYIQSIANDLIYLCLVTLCRALAWLRATVFAEIMLHRRAILFHDININSRIWIVTKEKDCHRGRHTCNIKKKSYTTVQNFSFQSIFLNSRILNTRSLTFYM